VGAPPLSLRFLQGQGGDFALRVVAEFDLAIQKERRENCVMSILTVAERPDMDYNISVDGKLAHESVTRLVLKRQLAHYNIVDGRYDELMRELAGKGKASTEIRLGKFEQVKYRESPDAVRVDPTNSRGRKERRNP